MEKIRNTLTGKSGPMKAGIETFKSLTPQTPVTSAMRQFQKEVIESKLSDNLKAEILGLGTALNVDFGVDTFKGKLSPQKLTDPKTFMQQYKEATNLGTGDERDDQIDEDTFSDFTTDVDVAAGDILGVALVTGTSTIDNSTITIKIQRKGA